jgi:hypothetical protein
MQRQRRTAQENALREKHTKRITSVSIKIDGLLVEVRVFGWELR